MSYNLTLQCGCLVYVACDPLTTLAHTRILERRDPGCRVRKHEIGLRLSLWEIVPALVEVGTDQERRSVPTREATPGGAPCSTRNELSRARWLSGRP